MERRPCKLPLASQAAWRPKKCQMPEKKSRGRWIAKSYVKNLPEEDKALTPGGPSEDKVLTAEPSLKPTRTKKVNPRYHGPMWAV
jgi:hypothetical protein